MAVRSCSTSPLRWSGASAHRTRSGAEVFPETVKLFFPLDRPQNLAMLSLLSLSDLAILDSENSAQNPAYGVASCVLRSPLAKADTAERAKGKKLSM